MKATIKYNNLESAVEITHDNIDDFIAYLTQYKKPPMKLNNDPNPLMCYSGNKRVIPGTSTRLEVDEWDWETGKLKNRSFVDICYDICGYRMYNCTPHDIFFKNPRTGEIIKLQSCGIAPRIYRQLYVDGVGTDGIFFLEEVAKVNVPAPYHDVKFIVSRMVFDILPNRLDIIAPNTLMQQTVNGNTVVTGFVAREGVI